MRRGPWIAPIVVAGCATILVAGLGMTMTELGPWYRSLRQPSWTPPDWAFGVIWTTMFSLIAIAAVTGWRRAPDENAESTLIGLFALNGTLNLLWSWLFFKLQRPDWALVEVAFLWLSTLALILVLYRYAKLAALLLMPYLVWVGVAAMLNYQIVQLNGSFK